MNMRRAFLFQLCDQFFFCATIIPAQHTKVVGDFTI